MKILQINTTVNIGSTGRIAEKIGIAVINTGNESVIAAGYGINSVSKKIVIGSYFDRIIHALITRLFDAHGFGSGFFTRLLISRIKRENPDIIHLHNIHGYYINIRLLFKYLKKCDKKIIWTLHDCWAFTGHCSHFERINCYKWVTECSKCPLQRRYPSSWFLDRSRTNYNSKKIIFNGVQNLHIVVPSQWLFNHVKNSFLNSYPLNLINNGVNLLNFKRKSTFSLIRSYIPFEKKKKIVLGVANVWDPIKGLNDFIKLSAVIDDAFIICLVGLKEEQLHDLPGNIIGIPKTNNLEELAELYSYSTVFINPTYVDTFPTTNIEALACGTPVITYASGGSPEIIDNNTGIICEKGDIEAINRGIHYFDTLDNSLTIEYCRNRAITFYNEIDRISDYLKLYGL